MEFRGYVPESAKQGTLSTEDQARMLEEGKDLLEEKPKLTAEQQARILEEGGSLLDSAPSVSRTDSSANESAPKDERTFSYMQEVSLKNADGSLDQGWRTMPDQGGSSIIIYRTDNRETPRLVNKAELQITEEAPSEAATPEVGIVTPENAPSPEASVVIAEANGETPAEQPTNEAERAQIEAVERARQRRNEISRFMEERNSEIIARQENGFKNALNRIRRSTFARTVTGVVGAAGAGFFGPAAPAFRVAVGAVMGAWAGDERGIAKQQNEALRALGEAYDQRTNEINEEALQNMDAQRLIESMGKLTEVASVKGLQISSEVRNRDQRELEDMQRSREKNFLTRTMDRIKDRYEKMPRGKKMLMTALSIGLGVGGGMLVGGGAAAIAVNAGIQLFMGAIRSKEHTAQKGYEHSKLVEALSAELQRRVDEGEGGFTAEQAVQRIQDARSGARRGRKIGIALGAVTGVLIAGAAYEARKLMHDHAQAAHAAEGPEHRGVTPPNEQQQGGAVVETGRTEILHLADKTPESLTQNTAEGTGAMRLAREVLKDVYRDEYHLDVNKLPKGEFETLQRELAKDWHDRGLFDDSGRLKPEYVKDIIYRINGIGEGKTIIDRLHRGEITIDPALAAENKPGIVEPTQGSGVSKDAQVAPGGPKEPIPGGTQEGGAKNQQPTGIAGLAKRAWAAVTGQKPQTTTHYTLSTDHHSASGVESSGHTGGASHPETAQQQAAEIMPGASDAERQARLAALFNNPEPVTNHNPRFPHLQDFLNDPKTLANGQSEVDFNRQGVHLIERQGRLLALVQVDTPSGVRYNTIDVTGEYTQWHSTHPNGLEHAPAEQPTMEIDTTDPFAGYEDAENQYKSALEAARVAREQASEAAGLLQMRDEDVAAAKRMIDSFPRYGSGHGGELEWARTNHLLDQDRFGDWQTRTGYHGTRETLIDNPTLLRQYCEYHNNTALSRLATLQGEADQIAARLEAARAKANTAEVVLDSARARFAAVGTKVAEAIRSGNAGAGATERFHHLQETYAQTAGTDSKLADKLYVEPAQGGATEVNFGGEGSNSVETPSGPSFGGEQSFVGNPTQRPDLDAFVGGQEVNFPQSGSGAPEGMGGHNDGQTELSSVPSEPQYTGMPHGSEDSEGSPHEAAQGGAPEQPTVIPPAKLQGQAAVDAVHSIESINPNYASIETLRDMISGTPAGDAIKNHFQAYSERITYRTLEVLRANVEASRASGVLGEFANQSEANKDEVVAELIRLQHKLFPRR